MYKWRVVQIRLFRRVQKNTAIEPREKKGEHGAKVGKGGSVFFGGLNPEDERGVRSVCAES